MTDDKKGRPAPHGGVRGIAEMLNLMDDESRERLLANVAQRDPSLADNIRKQMFVFEDLTKLGPLAMQTLLREIPHQILVLALRNASVAVKEFFYQNLSEKMGTLLREEVDEQGLKRVTDIEVAQAEIIKLLKRLIAEGKIQPDAK